MAFRLVMMTVILNNFNGLRQHGQLVSYHCQWVSHLSGLYIFSDHLVKGDFKCSTGPKLKRLSLSFSIYLA